MKAILFIFLGISIFSSLNSYSQNARDSEDSTICFIDQIENNEEFSIKIFSRGYIYIHDSISISKSNEKYGIKYKGEFKELSIDEIESIRVFENRFSSCCEHFACSHIDEYTLVFKNKRRTLIDEGCEWYGFEILLNELGYKY